MIKDCQYCSTATIHEIGEGHIAHFYLSTYHFSACTQGGQCLQGGQQFVILLCKCEPSLQVRKHQAHPFALSSYQSQALWG